MLLSVPLSHSSSEIVLTTRPKKEEVHYVRFSIFFWSDIECGLFCLPIPLTQPSAGDYTVIIIIVAVIAVALFVSVGLIVYLTYYKQNRKGQYNLKDVFRLGVRHNRVPTTA